jgi:uridine kinase
MDLAGQLIERIARLEPPSIIAVSGFGGAGKSSFASALGHRIAAPVVGIDSFIIDRNMSQYARWEIMDFARLEREVLRPFRQRQPVQYGHFDWDKNTVGGKRVLPATGSIIVEGVGLFRPDLLPHFALLIWVDCPIQEAIERGKKRDRDEHSNGQDELWDGLWKENDEACYFAYQPKESAHFIINNSHQDIPDVEDTRAARR